MPIFLFKQTVSYNVHIHSSIELKGVRARAIRSDMGAVRRIVWVYYSCRFCNRICLAIYYITSIKTVSAVTSRHNMSAVRTIPPKLISVVGKVGILRDSIYFVYGAAEEKKRNDQEGQLNKIHMNPNKLEEKSA